MSDLIDRQAAIKAICEDGTWLESQGCTEITMVERKQRDADILGELPSAQSKRMIGRWVKDEEASSQHVESIYVCSACNNMDAWGEAEKNTFKFCPNCGADMRGEDDE